MEEYYSILGYLLNLLQLFFHGSSTAMLHLFSTTSSRKSFTIPTSCQDTIEAISQKLSPKRQSQAEGTLQCKQSRTEVQYLVLRKMFPDFPTNMLQCLIIQNNGNLRLVCDLLISKGWTTEYPKLKKGLQNSFDENLITPYYFGLCNKETLSQISSAKAGCYITYYRHKGTTHQYYLSIKTLSGTLEFPINGLIAPPTLLPTNSFPLSDNICKKVSHLPFFGRKENISALLAETHNI